MLEENMEINVLGEKRGRKCKREISGVKHL